MTANAFRELAAISHDLRKLGWNKLPTDIERAGIIICNTKTHGNLQSPKSCAKMGRLCKYMELETYYIADPTVDEFIDIMRHFVTEVTEYLFVFTSATKIHQNLIDEPSIIPLKGGSVDPDLLFDLMNSKLEESRIVFVMDGVNNPGDWDPEKNGATRDGVLIFAPYPDPAQADLEQFNSSQENLMVLEMNKDIKVNPEITGAELAAQMSKGLSVFGQKVYVASYPRAFATELGFCV